MSEETGSIPTWRWGWAPAHLATRAQLRADGLRPGGQPVVAQLEWRSWKATGAGGFRYAFLYDRRLAVAVRPMTPARARALAAAMAARRTCRSCGVEAEHCLPTSLGGVCRACDDVEVKAALAAFDTEGVAA